MRSWIWAALLSACAIGAAQAQIPDNRLRIGVLNDMNGPFAAQSGHGSVVAAEMAAEDFAPEAAGLKVEILAGDHQNKADIGTAIVRQWIDRDGVTAVTDAVNSGVGLAVNQVMKEKNRAFIATNVGTSDLTGKFCAPTTVQWNMDTWAFGNAIARAVYAQGGKTWYFIAVDYALGAALQRDATAELDRLGARVLWGVKAPLGTADFSSYLVQAQSSGAQVIGFANTGTDLSNAIKQASEFGITPKQKLAALFAMITDVDAVGLPTMQGVLLAESFYWDLNDPSRVFAKRFAERMGGRVPTANQAMVYSSVLAYLRAAKAANTIEGERVVAEMKRAPIPDPFFGTVTVRADGRAIHPMYVFRVKSPADSKGRWDDYDLLTTIPADQAFRPLADGGCALVGK